MLSLCRISSKNIDLASRIQHELFPLYSARKNYEESVAGLTNNEYYLLYEGDTPIGITGIYWYESDPESAWLGWFGIRKQFRRRHLGSVALGLYEEMAKKKGFRYARLYTDKDDNDIAISFYKSNGYVGEPYVNAQDPACFTTEILIFSKSLTEERVVPWNNRNIDLTKQIEKQS